MAHRTDDELTRGLDHVRRAPTDGGTVDLVVRRLQQLKPSPGALFDSPCESPPSGCSAAFGINTIVTRVPRAGMASVLASKSNAALLSLL